MFSKRRVSHVLLVLVALMLLLVPRAALAASTDPVTLPTGGTVDITSITVSQHELYPGDSAHITIESDAGPDVSFAVIRTLQGGGMTGIAYLSDPEDDGLFEGDFFVYEGTPGGEVYASAIFVIPNSAAETGSMTRPPFVIAMGDGGDEAGALYRDISALHFTVINDVADTTPPQVDVGSLVVSPTSATVGDTVTFAITAYDDFGMSDSQESGIQLTYYAGRSYYTRSIVLQPDGLGRYVGSLEVTEDSAPYMGTWRLSEIRAIDNVGNVASVSSSAIGDVGSFELVDIPETTPPVFTYDIAAATREPTDAVLEAGTKVTVTIPMTVVGNGAVASITFRSPTSGAQVALSDNGDGTWGGSFVIPQGSYGEWFPSALFLGTTYSPGPPRYLSGSMAPNLVFSVDAGTGAELTPPVIDLDACYVEHKTVHASTSNPYHIFAADDTGVNEVLLGVVLPSGQAAGGGDYSLYRSYDSGENAWWTPCYGSESGTWRVDHITAIDVFGNESTVYNSYFHPEDPNAVDLSFLDYERVNESESVRPTIDLSSLDVTPDSVTVGERFTVSVDITDDSGIDWARAYVCPEGWLSNSESGIWMDLSSEDGVTWTSYYSIDRTRASGRWCVKRIEAHDVYGNVTDVWNSETSYTPSGDLSGGDFEVYGTLNDTTPPTYVAGTASTMPKVAAQGSGVYVSLDAVDDCSSSLTVQIEYSTSGHSTHRYGLYPTGAGDTYAYCLDNYALDGVGKYTVWQVTMRDESGNLATYRRGAEGSEWLSDLDFEIVGAGRDGDHARRQRSQRGHRLHGCLCEQRRCRKRQGGCRGRRLVHGRRRETVPHRAEASLHGGHHAADDRSAEVGGRSRRA